MPIAKLDPSGANILYATYLGGSSDDNGAAIAADAAGNAYVTGTTSSKDFPLVNPLPVSSSGVLTAFVAKLDAHGTTLVYSTLLGSKASVTAGSVYPFTSSTGIVSDASGNA